MPFYPPDTPVSSTPMFETGYANAATVTPSDTTTLATPSRALWVGTTGNLAITMLGGQVVTPNSVPVGLLPIAASKVMAAGTTASNIVALW